MCSSHATIIAILPLIAICAFAAGAGASKENNASDPSNSAVYSPPPKYPIQARREGFEGDGLLPLDIEATTGKVKKVAVLKSTGHTILDNAGAQAFRQWRFPSGPARSVKIPLDFKLEGVESEKGIAQAVYSPPPEYPMQARSQLSFLAARDYGQQGSGLFRLVLDRETGTVIRVKALQSTGVPTFDRAAISAFQRWRFKAPTTFDTVLVPVTFMVPRLRTRSHWNVY
jgi:TonB family protein